MRVLVCGSRSRRVSNQEMRLALKKYGATYVFSGGARGPDTKALEVAKEMGIDHKPIKPDWSLGRSAGIQRNLKMLDMEPDLVLAFWDGESNGTKHTITEAHKRGIEVVVKGTHESSRDAYGHGLASHGRTRVAQPDQGAGEDI